MSSTFYYFAGKNDGACKLYRSSYFFHRIVSIKLENSHGAISAMMAALLSSLFDIDNYY